MRERITYVQKLGDSLEPSAVTVDSSSGISGPEVHAVREDRLTIALSELPPELRSLVTDAQDLHIRWVSAASYELVSPLLARIPPGFHLFYSPGRNDSGSNKLCSTLADIFGEISCSTPAKSFTDLRNGRFQYFQELGGLTHFVEYAKGQLCHPADDNGCSARIEGLSTAGSLDVSYEAGQDVLRITALWPYQRRRVRAASHPRLRTEVGILSTDKPKTLEAHEVGISGLLTVLGQDSKPSPTMFSFASRHRDAESAFSARFLAPTGLHPTLQLRLSSRSPRPLSEGEGGDARSCHPYAYLTLPRTIFADKYQLSDPLFLASKNLAALRHTTQPVDLEAPEYAMSQWGSAILVQLAPPEPEPEPEPEPGPSSSSASRSQGRKSGGDGQDGAEDEWTAEIPLHLRYLAPTRGGYATISVPYPAVFWACEPEQEGAVAFPPNPFEKAHLGYDGLFEEGTVFWHVQPRPPAGSVGDGLLVNEVRVPVLDVEKAGWVNAGTAAAVAVGFAWIVWKLIGVYLRHGYGGGVEREEEKVKKRQ